MLDFAVKDLMVTVLPERVSAECSDPNTSPVCPEPPSGPPCSDPNTGPGCPEPPSGPPCSDPNTGYQCPDPPSNRQESSYRADGPEFRALSMELERIIAGA